MNKDTQPAFRVYSVIPREGFSGTAAGDSISACALPKNQGQPDTLNSIRSSQPVSQSR
jgi:hypothetical protein